VKRKRKYRGKIDTIRWFVEKVEDKSETDVYVKVGLKTINTWYYPSISPNKNKWTKSKSKSPQKLETSNSK